MAKRDDRREVPLGTAVCAVALGLACLLLSANRTRAQAEKAGKPEPKPKLQVCLSTKADDKAPQPALSLRPNLSQEVFVFVKNDEDTDQVVTVQLLAGGAPVVQVKDFRARARSVTRVPMAPPAGPTPPPLAEVKGTLQFRLATKEDKTLGEDVEVKVARPAQYIAPPKTSYDKDRRRLVVQVQASNEFTGPRCRVELELRPDRIPGLVPGQKKKGIYGGYLNKGETLDLVAEDLQFRPAENKNGIVYLKIDGYDRAFAYETSFDGNEPQWIQKEGLRLDVKPVVPATPELPVVVEVDNARPDARVKLEVLSQVGSGEEATGDKGWSELAEFLGDRDQRVFFAPSGPEGGVLFQPRVMDWSAKVNTSEIHGTARLRLRMFEPGKKEPIEIRDNAENKVARQVFKTIRVLDGPPEGVRFVEAPKKVILVEDAKVPLAATAEDPEDVQEAVFFVGKPLPEDKLPSQVYLGEYNPERKVWTATLLVPPDQKNTLDVGVQFTNRAGLKQTRTLTLKLEPPAPPVARKASIEGVVVEGPLTQDGLDVELRDERGALKAKATTKDGKFLFTDLSAGIYTVSTVKVASNTRGAYRVVITEKDEKEGVKKDAPIELFR